MIEKGGFNIKVRFPLSKKPFEIFAAARPVLA